MELARRVISFYMGFLALCFIFANSNIRGLAGNHSNNPSPSEYLKIMYSWFYCCAI